jgi:hypothetical protein
MAEENKREKEEYLSKEFSVFFVFACFCHSFSVLSFSLPFRVCIFPPHSLEPIIFTIILKTGEGKKKGRK